MDGCDKCSYETKVFVVTSRRFLTSYANYHMKLPAGIPVLVECSSALDSAACFLKLPLVIFLLGRSEQVCSNQKGSAPPPQVNGNPGLIGNILKTNMLCWGHLDNLMPV